MSSRGWHRRFGRRLIGSLRDLLRDRSGMTAIYVGLSFTFLFGAAALSFDLARLMTEQSELQSAADAAALAGAVELDGQSGALDRARAAANGAFGNNIQTFATDNLGLSVTIESITFLSALASTDPPLLPPNPAPSGDRTTNSDTAATFIRVSVRSRSIANAFITLVGGPSLAGASAVATAGTSQVICGALPLFICNPSETNDTLTFNPSTGDQLIVKPKSGCGGGGGGGGGCGGAYAPGNYGFLDPPNNITTSNTCVPQTNNQGTSDLTTFLAQNQSLGCTSTTVNTRTGNPTPASQGLNTRFDLWPNGNGQLGANSKSNACYAPAPNVVKGYLPGNGANGACNPNQVSDPEATGFPQNTGAVPFPLDSCFDPTSPSGCLVSGIMGNGNWDLTTYWTYNHQGAVPGALTTFAQGLTPPGITPANKPSRYAVYLYEINNSLIPQPNPPITTVSPVNHLEEGRIVSGNTQPQCFSGAPSDPTGRRLINVAVVNCAQQGVTGDSKNVRPIGFFQGFMTNPVNSNNGNLYLETVQELQPNAANGLLHTTVQLYR